MGVMANKHTCIHRFAHLKHYFFILQIHTSTFLNNQQSTFRPSKLFNTTTEIMSSYDEAPSADVADNDYVSRPGQKDTVPVQSDDAPVEDPVDSETADSDQQLGTSYPPPSLASYIWWRDQTIANACVSLHRGR